MYIESKAVRSSRGSGLRAVARRLSRVLLAVSAMIATEAVGVGQLHAATCRTESDACRSTYLCFEDYETGCWGRLSGTNSDWNEFGWADRTDWFENHGTSCNARVFRDTWYSGPVIASLARGQAQSASPYWDAASSNNWYNCR